MIRPPLFMAMESLRILVNTMAMQESGQSIVSGTLIESEFKLPPNWEALSFDEISERAIRPAAEQISFALERSNPYIGGIPTFSTLPIEPARKFKHRHVVTDMQSGASLRIDINGRDAKIACCVSWTRPSSEGAD